ncbi:MAG: hypothetical protein AB7P00_38880, partial [Sandaracinaceae bacterium]
LLGLFVGGFILSQWWMSIFAVFGVLFLARSFLGQIRQMRLGVLSTARIVEIQHDWGPGAANEGVMVDGRPMNVSFDPRILRAFLAAGYEAEARVVYAEERKPVAAAFAYRPVRPA